MNILTILILLLTSCSRVDSHNIKKEEDKVNTSSLENKYTHEIKDLKDITFFYSEELKCLNCLAPSLIIVATDEKCNKEEHITPKYSLVEEFIIFENALKRVGQITIREEAFNFIHDYLLALNAPLIWLKDYLDLFDFEKEDEDLINRTSVENINYNFSTFKYNKNEDEDARKDSLNFSLEYLQKMADDSERSGIVYEKVVDNEVSYLYPKLIISQLDNIKYNLRRGKVI